MEDPAADGLETGIAAPPEPLIDANSLAALAPAWGELARAARSHPFARPEWVTAWLRHGQPVAEPVFLSVRLGEELVGVAAFDIDRDTARILGDPDVTDYPPVVALPGYETVVAEGLLEWMREDLTPRVELWGIAEDSPLRPAFAAAAERRGWAYAEEAEVLAPRAELDGGWEAYLARLTKHDRHELRRKLRNFSAAGKGEYEELVEPGACRAALEDLFRLMRASHEGKAHFLTAEREAFFRDAIVAAAEAGFARLGLLRLDGAVVAVTVCLESEEWTFLYNSGYDPGVGRLAPGFVAKAHALRSAASRGRRVFDFLRGAEEYKRRLGGRPYQLYRIRLHSVA